MPYNNSFPPKSDKFTHSCMNSKNQTPELMELQETLHRLKTRLMSIEGYAQGIEHGIFEDPAAAGKKIREECELLINEAKVSLELSYIEHSDISSALHPVYLQDFLQDCLSRFEPQATQKGIHLSLVMENENAAILATDSLLENIFENLLSNAIRYARQSIRIRVTSENANVEPTCAETIDTESFRSKTADTESAGTKTIIPKPDNIKITVTDDGDGIDEQDLPHIFKRLYIGKNGSSGLGLSIVKAAAEKMGGKITASNAAEGGAEFTLILPTPSAPQP